MPGAPLFTRSDAAALDANDPLRNHKAQFVLPEGEIYLDGNSLGALPVGVTEALARTVQHDWGTRLIRSWNEAGWFPAPARVGALVAPLIGAQPHEVVACDSLSINLFKCMAAAVQMRPGRRTIIGEIGNFPSDAYINQGVAHMLDAKVIDVEREDIEAAIAEAGDDLAVVELNHAHYKTGELFDIERMTAITHAAGGLIVWDLSHSAGAMPIQLSEHNVDFAAGCGYKYLNGGPGAPAFVYVAERHHSVVDQPLTGWFGHKDPFAFSHAYEPAAGMGRMLVGTTQMLSMVALESALQLWADVDLNALRVKSMAMGDLFIRLINERLHTYGFTVVSPRDAAQRGSHVSMTHENGYAIMQALIARGIIGDFRAPDILRFGFTPLYVGFTDLWDCVDALADIMQSGAWDTPAFTTRKTVT
jgi:kynureninase